MDLFQAKCILSRYGNVAITQKSIKAQESEFNKFIEENQIKIDGPFGNEEYMIISSKKYKLGNDEYTAEMNKHREIKRKRIKEVAPLTKDEFEKKYKALINQIKREAPCQASK